MKKVFLFLLLPVIVTAQSNYDVIIRNGKIVDGTGTKIYGDIGIRWKIASIQKHLDGSAARTIDAKAGLLLPRGLSMCIRI